MAAGLSGALPAGAFAPAGLGTGRGGAPSAPPPSPPPASSPSIGAGRSGSSSSITPRNVGAGEVGQNRRPGLYQSGARPPFGNPGPPSQGGHGRGHRHDHDYYYVPYYPYAPFYAPFYGPYDYGYGYGLFPYAGPFGANDYYYYDRYQLPGYSENNRPYEADRGKANVTLKIEPRDVEVYVNGVLAAHDGRAALNLPTGRWRLEFVRSGYRTETVDLDVTQGVTYRIDRRLERLRDEEPRRDIPLGDTGELRLDVQPADAIVYLDGRALGLAEQLPGSAALRRIPAGRHVIEVRRPGYVTVSREVVISPVQPAVLDARLKRE